MSATSSPVSISETRLCHILAAPRPLKEGSCSALPHESHTF